MRKTITGLLVFFIFSVIVVRFGSAADDGLAEDLTAATSTPAVNPILLIVPADDNPTDKFYNSGDRGKFFLSFDLIASSSESLYVDEIRVKAVDSISSAFFNPGIAGDNLENITIVSGETGNSVKPAAIDVTDGSRTFSGLDLIIESGKPARLRVYADIAAGMDDAVESRIILVDPTGIKAVGTETGKRAEISGAAEGDWTSLKPAEPKADLVLSGIYINQNQEHNNIVIGEPTYINIIYKNNGNGPAPENFGKIFDFGGEGVFEFGNNGEPISTSSGYYLSSGTLLGSEEYAELYAGIFRSAGEIELTVTLDPEDLIPETDDRNNVFTENIIVFEELNYPDFIVYDIITDPISPLGGEDVRIDVVYKNIGSDYDRDKFSTMVYFGQAEGWFIFDERRPLLKSRSYPNMLEPLKTGETITETYWGRFGRDRTIELEAAVDTFKEVEEANEGNNRFLKKIVIRKKEAAVAAVPGRSALALKLKGRIILKVEGKGEAYYINPASAAVNFLGRPDDAFKVMREQGVGIKNIDLGKIPVGSGAGSGADTDGDGLSDALEDALGTDKEKADTDGDGLSDREESERGSNPAYGRNLAIITDNGFAAKHKGKIFLQTERNGEAWYVNPADNRRYFLGRPADAWEIMRTLGLGISNADFKKL
ncbi:MAG: CARDB domain-containing protein [Candidatus Falkowbacteria bacterium]